MLDSTFSTKGRFVVNTVIKLTYFQIKYLIIFENVSKNEDLCEKNL